MTNNYDVIICGAGVAGVAAALETARAGLQVALVEKTILPGGLATSGLVYYYLPLCDGQGTQVTFGLAEELLRLSLKYGPGDIPPGWNADPPTARLQAVFSPASFVLALDEALQEAGVTLWLDTLVCTPLLDGDRICGVEVEHKGGRDRLLAPVVIDATGDADIALRAGVPCESCPNILSLWALQATLDAARQAVDAHDGTALLNLFAFGGDAADPAVEDAERSWTLASAGDVTAFVMAAREVLREHYRETQALAGRQHSFPLTLPTMAQYRMTRRIHGAATLHAGEAWQRHADAVGLVADWRTRGSVWEIPYGTLLPVGIHGLLAVGRCIAADGDAWHVTRVIPAAALTGQVAGVATCLAHARHCPPDALDVTELQTELRHLGIPCTLDEVYRERLKTMANGR